MSLDMSQQPDDVVVDVVDVVDDVVVDDVVVDVVVDVVDVVDDVVVDDVVVDVVDAGGKSNVGTQQPMNSSSHDT